MTLQTIEKKPVRGLAHNRLTNQFHEYIKHGKWSVNSIIPSENMLAEQHKVSRDTIRKALQSLVKEGLLRTEQGRGRIVIEKSTKNTQMRNIGMVIHELVDDDYGEFTEMYSVLRQRNYNLYLYTFKADNQDLVKCLSDISGNHVSGLLVYCQQVLKQDIVEFNNHIKTVALFHNVSEFSIPSYYMAWSLTANDASMHLFERGFSEQFLVCSAKSHFTDVNNQLIQGIQFAHFKNGYDLDTQRLIRSSSDSSIPDSQTLTKSCKAILDRLALGSRIGVICYSNWVAVELAFYAAHNGIKIPDQLGIVALQDSHYLTKSPVNLTAFNFDRKALVRQGVIRLLDTIDGRVANESFDNPFYGKLLFRSST